MWSFSNYSYLKVAYYHIRTRHSWNTSKFHWKILEDFAYCARNYEFQIELYLSNLCAFLDTYRLRQRLLTILFVFGLECLKFFWFVCMRGFFYAVCGRSPFSESWSLLFSTFSSQCLLCLYTSLRTLFTSLSSISWPLWCILSWKPPQNQNMFAVRKKFGLRRTGGRKWKLDCFAVLSRNLDWFR